ncbi:isocitrate lyase/phosphoenolpyruvate mutase family protein [Hymenobacter lutimineralis]|uniref:Isocitrate lyase/phosphoenolpyruvate mutase family protein n=1 Tax=Hymenobacter lutimineralis TaxID=2606448 RepID=A0A5D6VC94_9BACT|nr:isocitrate lyase/phosphoenolpyruvate mutase family protein [Hymenobacter lutimineralis]TYZ12489.1 isocitrate lyase/phosphoenolpyruvate mutase family protein [Hymenobacter lutimineralis]
MSSTRSTYFHHLHHQSEPLLLPNVWDARSAAICQQNGFVAVGTSSAAIASALGYTDGEQLPFTDLLRVVERICAATTLPVTVDLEAGYSRDVATICEHIAQLHALGVVGINLEDSLVSEGSRYLVDAADFARTLAQIKAFCRAHDMPLFLNARTDTYLLGLPDALPQTQARMQAYAAAGADGLFVPGLAEVAAMQLLCRQTSLPVNVLCVPGLPGWADLKQAGIKRVSMGNFLFELLARRQEQVGALLQQTRQLNVLFQ